MAQIKKLRTFIIPQYLKLYIVLLPLFSCLSIYKWQTFDRHTSKQFTSITSTGLTLSSYLVEKQKGNKVRQRAFQFDPVQFFEVPFFIKTAFVDNLHQKYRFNDDLNLVYIVNSKPYGGFVQDYVEIVQNPVLLKYQNA